MKWEEVKLESPNKVSPIEEVKLEAHDRDTGFKAVVDKTTMNTICVIPDAYAIIPHAKVLEQVTNLKNYTIKEIILSLNGRMLMVDVTEREPKKIELLPNDYLECGARITNDYGRSRGLSIQGYATRLVCSNGVVAPTRSASIPIEAFGTDKFAIEIEEKINKALNVWVEEAELFKLAHAKKVHTKDILPEHTFLPKKAMEEITGKLKDEETVYDIWNAFTFVIQHTLAEKKQKLNVIGLQRRANKILEVAVPQA